MSISIEALGLTKDEIIERVVSRAVGELLRLETYDEDGEPYGSKPSQFAISMQAQIKQKIDQAIDEIAAKNVLPNVASYVEGLCLQETNKWGEKTGTPKTFIEYLVSRAEAYLTEPVNYDGKSQSESNYNWSKSSTRVAHLVHQHLQYSIEAAMKQAMLDINKSVAGGLHEAVRIKLNEVAAKLKVEVKA